MSEVLTVLGLLLLGLGGYASARLWFRLPRGLAALLGGLLLGWVWLSVETLALGLAGYLTRAALLAGLIPVVVPALILWTKSNGQKPEPTLKTGDRLGWDGGLALGLTLWAVIAFAIPSILLAVKVVSDGPIYHLYFAAKWWKAGRIFLIPIPFGESAATYFPAVGDLWLTWLFVVGGGDSIAKVGQIPFLGFASVVVYALARWLGSGVNASTIATCLFATVTPLLFFSFEANVDTLFVAGYLVAVTFGLRFFRNDDGPGSLAIAALAAGAAWGCKATGIVFVPPILGLAVVGVLLRGDGWKVRCRNLAIIILCPMVMEGYWLARNAALTGNPFYPLHVAIGGLTLFQGWYDAEAMSRSIYYIDRSDWRSCVDLFLAVFDPRLVLIGIAALAGAWCVGRPEKPTDAWVWICSGLALLNMALYWVLIPYRTQLRFLLHSAGLVAIPIAAMIDRGRWLRWIAVGALAFHVLTPQGWPFVGEGGRPPWDLSPFVPNGAGSPVPLFADLSGLQGEPGTSLPTLAAIRIGVGVGCAVWGLSLVWACRGGVRRWTVPIAGCVLILMTQTHADMSRRATVTYRYPIFADYLRGWIDLEGRTPPGGVRIAYAGTNLPYYLMGNGFRNDVRYVNVDAHPGWLMHDYHREAVATGQPPAWPDTRPGWDRAKPDYRAWLQNLRTEGIQLLVVNRANPAEGRHNVADAQGFPIERVWADAHRDVFRPLYTDPHFRLYAVTAPK